MQFMTREQADACIKYGKDAVANYKSGLNDHSLAMTVRNAASSPIIQRESKAAEMIFALEHGLDPMNENVIQRDVSRGASQWDVIIPHPKPPRPGVRLLVDVKGSGFHAQYLIYSRLAFRKIRAARWDVLTMTLVACPMSSETSHGQLEPVIGEPRGWRGETVGWLKRDEFIRKCVIAGEGHGRFDEGTPFVERDELHKPEWLFAEHVLRAKQLLQRQPERQEAKSGDQA